MLPRCATGMTGQPCLPWDGRGEAPAAGRECLRLLLRHGHLAEALQVCRGFDEVDLMAF